MFVVTFILFPILIAILFWFVILCGVGILMRISDWLDNKRCIRVNWEDWER